VLFPELRWGWEHLAGQCGIAARITVAHRTVLSIDARARFKYIFVDSERRGLILTSGTGSNHNPDNCFLEGKSWIRNRNWNGAEPQINIGTHDEQDEQENYAEKYLAVPNVGDILNHMKPFCRLDTLCATFLMCRGGFGNIQIGIHLPLFEPAFLG
jgi:hypothetical protein